MNHDRLYGRRYRRRWWSLLNWLHGYKFGPIRRCRRCDHTSPRHYPDCALAAEVQQTTETIP